MESNSLNVYVNKNSYKTTQLLGQEQLSPWGYGKGGVLSWPLLIKRIMKDILDKAVRQKVEEKEEEIKLFLHRSLRKSMKKHPPPEKKTQWPNVPGIIINYSVATMCMVNVQMLTAFLYNNNE